MALRNLTLRTSYNKIDHDIARDFYLPCMQNAVTYDRATGYFGSTVYILSWRSLKSFVKEGGKLRIICSPYLAVQDQNAISEGIESLSSSEQKDNLFKELNEIFKKSSLNAPERLLACFISAGILQIKIAVGKYDPSRLFHDKVGLFYDTNNDIVAFRGSINETFKGLSDDGNFESLDVFQSWRDSSDYDRVKDIQDQFNRIWNNNNDKVQAFDIPSDIKQAIETHAKKQKNWEEVLDEVLVDIDTSLSWSADKRPNGKRPRRHQLNSLEAWEDNGRLGLFEHATGSGKTFSAMCAIRKCLEEGSPILVLVPSVGLLDQWYKELKEMFYDLDIQYLLCGGGNSTWKEDMTLQAFSDPNLDDLRITIAVMDTASDESFYKNIIASNKLLVVADEAHRLGSPNRRSVFNINAGYRLGLSATPKRYGDPEGTEAILSYFHGIVGEPYTLKNAIDDNVLCHYFYYPHIVKLTPKEQSDWNDLSKKISTMVARLMNENDSSSLMKNQKLRKLLIERSRITKNAKAKVNLAVDVLSNDYKEGERWIVYCDNRTQMDEVLASLTKLNLRAYEYHSELSKDVKEQTLEYFTNIGGIVVSIRCLDEGIDIPNTTHALILASSQNPREFVQRRGRILRKSDNKNFSYLHDAIVIPDDFNSIDDTSKIIETELLRAIQFGEWSEDHKCIVDLKLLAIKNNINFNDILNTGLSYE